jgi:hypothetical protein
LKRESEQARIDYLTRVSNARDFYEQAEREIARAARYIECPKSVGRVRLFHHARARRQEHAARKIA